MNDTSHPTLATSDAIAGIVFQKQAPNASKTMDRQAMEKACVDLISKLEHTLANANEMSKIDFIDESATVAGEMLDSLQSFCDQFLDGKALEQAREEIDRGKTMCTTFEEILKTRSIGKALLRTFWKADESAEIQSARDQLGESLIRACAATLYHAIILIGFETPFGKEVDASTVVFVNELKQSW